MGLSSDSIESGATTLFGSNSMNRSIAERLFASRRDNLSIDQSSFVNAWISAGDNCSFVFLQKTTEEKAALSYGKVHDFGMIIQPGTPAGFISESGEFFSCGHTTGIISIQHSEYYIAVDTENNVLSKDPTDILITSIKEESFIKNRIYQSVFEHANDLHDDVLSFYRIMVSIVDSEIDRHGSEPFWDNGFTDNLFMKILIMIKDDEDSGDEKSPYHQMLLSVFEQIVGIVKESSTYFFDHQDDMAMDVFNYPYNGEHNTEMS